MLTNHHQVDSYSYLDKKRFECYSSICYEEHKSEDIDMRSLIIFEVVHFYKHCIYVSVHYWEKVVSKFFLTYPVFPDKHCAFAVAAILQFPAVHKKRPPKSGYRRTKINRMKHHLLIKIWHSFLIKFIDHASICSCCIAFLPSMCNTILKILFLKIGFTKTVDL